MRDETRREKKSHDYFETLEFVQCYGTISVKNNMFWIWDF
jgi:hypothetical protein